MKRTHIRYATITLAGALFLYGLDWLGFFQGLDNYAYDLFFRLRGSQVPSSEVVIVAVDEETLADKGRWPIPRRIYATLLGHLRLSSTVVFDIIFAEPSTDDSMLRDAINRHGRVVLPAYLANRTRVILPVDRLKGLPVGHVHINQDVDGVVRSVPHTIHMKGVALPSISSLAWEMTRGKSFPRSDPVPGRKTAISGLAQQDLRRIYYYGPPGSIRRVSLTSILSGAVPDGFFRGRVVVVGVTAPGIEPDILTPFAQAGNRSPGVELQAGILSNILESKGITDLAPWLKAAICLILTIFSALGFLRLNETRALVGLTISILSVGVGAFLLFLWGDLWVGPTVFAGILVLTFAVSYGARLISAGALLDDAYVRALANLRWKRDDGAPSRVSVEAPGFWSTGGINRKIAMMEEIIGHLLFEKNLVDATLSSGIYGVLLFRPFGPLVLANEKAREFLGSLIEGLYSDEEFINAVLPLAVDGEARKRLENADGMRAGSSFTLAITKARRLFVRMDVDSIVLGPERFTVFVLSDITEFKTLELRRADVVDAVTHELKQPLTIIGGYADLIRLGKDDHKGEYLQKISEEVKRMAGLINTFLDLSRLESGKREVVMRTIDASHLSTETVNRLKPLADRKGIEVDVRCPGKIDILADERLFLRSLSNIVENAIKYCPSGSVVIVDVSENSGTVVVSVIDNGPGIDETELTHIFDKFYRVRNEQVMSVAGPGLGLALVKEAMEAMGASVSVDSRAGRGSVFTMTFRKRQDG